MNEFGNFLSSLRKSKGMTQQELADRLGVTNKAISKWETGDALPDTALLVPIADIFGVSVDELLRGHADNTHADGQSVFEKKQDPEKERDRIVQKYAPESWRKHFALLICLGLGFILCGVLTVITFGLVTDDEDMLLIGIVIMLMFITAGVPLFIVAGILNDNAFLPVPDPLWRKKVNRFAAFIASGVGAIMLAVICFVACGSFEEGSKAFIAGISGGFVVLFGGVVLLVYGGIFWEGYSKRVKANLENKKDAQAEDALAALTTNDRKHDTLGGRISGIIMLSATAIYLVIGFVWSLWHPGWVVFPVAGLLCGIINIILGEKR